MRRIRIWIGVHKGRAATLAIAAACLAMSSSAWAEDVSGQIKFEPNRLPKSEVKYPGFVKRIANPIKPARSSNPRPELVVVLIGDGGDRDAGPNRIRYDLLGESFESPILPVQAGAEVEIRNRGRTARVLYSPSHQDLVPSEVVNPTGTRSFKIARPLEPVLIQDANSLHLVGRIVAFPSGYFARVDERGNFEIKDVPEGKWTVRIWYRDGWIVRPEETIDVGRKKVRITPEIPSSLETKAPG